MLEGHAAHRGMTMRNARFTHFRLTDSRIFEGGISCANLERESAQAPGENAKNVEGSWKWLFRKPVDYPPDYSYSENRGLATRLLAVVWWIIDWPH